MLDQNHNKIGPDKIGPKKIGPKFIFSVMKYVQYFPDQSPQTNREMALRGLDHGMIVNLCDVEERRLSKGSA